MRESSSVLRRFRITHFPHGSSLTRPMDSINSTAISATPDRPSRTGRNGTFTSACCSDSTWTNKRKERMMSHRAGGTRGGLTLSVLLLLSGLWSMTAVAGEKPAISLTGHAGVDFFGTALTLHRDQWSPAHPSPMFDQETPPEEEKSPWVASGLSLVVPGDRK